jgi:asparagine synthase (glutamine-hydrolysing)
VPTYYVAKETRKHVTVALNGDGGDESFAGFTSVTSRWASPRSTGACRRSCAMSVIKETVNLLPNGTNGRSRIKSAKRLLERCRCRVSIATHVGSASSTSRRSNRCIPICSPTDEGSNRRDCWPSGSKRANGIGILDAMLLTDQMTYLPNDLLVKVDIATMAVSLEARSPFLDHHVIEFAASLPQHLKARRLTTKYLLKKVLRKLLPSENLNRRKMGFGVPIGHWFRGKMQPFLREVVLSDKALRRGLFKPEAVRQLVELHARGERDYSHQLWTLLMLELWFNRFID